MDHYILHSVAWCLMKVSRLPCVSEDPWPAWTCGTTLWVPWRSNQWHAHAEGKEILLTVTVSKLKALSLRFSSWNNWQFLFFCFHFNYFVCSSTESWSWTHKAIYSFAHTFWSIMERVIFLGEFYLLYFDNLHLHVQMQRMKFPQSCFLGDPYVVCNPLHKMYKLRSGCTRLLNVLRNLFCSFCGDM